MRIGIDASCWANQRGYGRFTRDLLKAMIALEPEHEYILFIDSVAGEQCRFPEGVQVVTVPSSSAATEAASASGYRSPTDMLRMGKVVSRTPMDILFYPSVYTYFPARTSAKTIVTFHDVIAELYPKMVFPNFRARFFWGLKTWLARFQADLILTVSEFSRQGIVRYFKIPPRKVAVTLEAADAMFHPVSRNGELQQIRRKYNLDEADRFFLYVGGIAPHKNLKTLINAFNLFQQAVNDPRFKLLIVGDFEGDAFWMDPEISNRARERTRSGDIRFTGYAPDEDLPLLYSAADALVLPSFCEGFGLPALEAMACATPVIGSDTTSLPEVVGEAGLFFHPTDVEQLAAHLQTLRENTTLRAQLSEKAYQRARQFTWEKAARTVLDIMKQLTEN